MEPTWTIEPELLDNADLPAFDTPFFGRFRLRTAPTPLRLTDDIAKDYLFPTFYGDVSCAIGIFLCSYERAAAMTPHPLVRPVRMTRGRSLVAFSCYEYRNVLGVAPYNEIAMTIPVLVDPGLSVPVLPMIWDGFRNFGYHVFSMPVTSLENQLRGLRIWGLPKVVQRIDVELGDGPGGSDAVTTAYEASGEPYFTLRVPTSGGKRQAFDVTGNLYTRLGKRFLQSETNFQGEFNVIKHMDLLVRKNKAPERAYLELGDTPSGRLLKTLEIEPHPFQFRYTPSMSSAFDLPNKHYDAPFRFSEEAR